MIESALTYCIFLTYLLMLATALFLRNTEKRIVVLLLSFLFVPSCVALYDHPSISARDTFLYIFFLGELIYNRTRLKELFLEFPLKIPLLFIQISFFATGFLADHEGMGQTLYETVRAFFDVFSFLFVGFYVGNEVKGERLLELFSKPIIIFCILGFMEAMLQDSVAFRYVCKAFPIYKGVYWLDGVIDLSESWRSRIIIVSDHPNALAGILISVFFFFFAFVDKNAPKIKNLHLILVMLGATSFLCGSRTLIFLIIAIVALYFFLRLGKLAKVVSATTLTLSLFLSAQAYDKFMETFNQEGQGSSIELRFVQLAVSYTYFMNSPIYGNGLHFIQRDILGTDSGPVKGDSEAKYFESLLFYLLINFGLVGLLSYMVLILTLLIYFMRRRKANIAASQGFLVTIALFAIMFLNGNSGNYFNCGLLLIGLCLGNCKAIELEESLNKEKQNSD